MFYCDEYKNTEMRGKRGPIGAEFFKVVVEFLNLDSDMEESDAFYAVMVKTKELMSYELKKLESEYRALNKEGE